MSYLRSLGLAALALVVLVAPSPAVAGTEAEEPPTPTVLEATPKEVERLIAAAEKANAEKDDKYLSRVLISMGERRDKAFAPVIKKAMGHKKSKVQALAIRAAASNQMEGETKRVLKLLKASKKKKKAKKKGGGDVSGYVTAAAIDFLARLAIEGAEEQVVYHLNRLFLVETRVSASYAPDLIRAAVHYLGQMKTMSAVPRLVDMLGEPQANPSDPNNPPATYWEARYELWHASEGWVRWALQEITGQKYRSQREWKAWAAANEKKFK